MGQFAENDGRPIGAVPVTRTTISQHAAPARRKLDISQDNNRSKCGASAASWVEQMPSRSGRVDEFRRRGARPAIRLELERRRPMRVTPKQANGCAFGMRCLLSPTADVLSHTTGTLWGQLRTHAPEQTASCSINLVGAQTPTTSVWREKAPSAWLSGGINRSSLRGSPM